MTVTDIPGGAVGNRLLRSVSMMLLVTATFACASAPRACADIAFVPSAEQALSPARARLDFEPLRPCARSGTFTISSVYVDIIPRGGTREPRISFVVASRGQEAFVWSQTRDTMPFTAIPAGTHHLTLGVGEITARGFAGPSGNGVDIAYIRWRSGGVTYELAATLHPWLAEAAVLDLADGLMRRAGGEP